MEIYGKIISALPPRTGTSARGTQWQCNTYVLETSDSYPRRVAFDVFGADRVAQFNIQIGESLSVSFDIDAREYQGRWYNTVRAFSVSRPAQPAGVIPPVPPAAAPLPAQPQPAAEEDLPF